MRFIIDDADYYVDVRGKAGPAIVLLHGFTGSMETWTDVMTEWTHECRVVRIDLPGHGQTVVHSPRTMEACCAELHRLFEWLELTDIHLVGYSMGGRTALSYAMLYPDHIASLVLESASPGLASAKERQKRRAQDEQLARQLEIEGVQRFVDFWENRPLFASQKKLPYEKRQAIRQERLNQQAEGLAGSLRAMGTGSQPSWWDRLSQLHIPVLLIVGQWDEKFVRINQNIIERLRNGKLEIVPHAGHAVHVEQPQIFAKIVERFIWNDR
ncbi:MAG TPA: 2-succinyl-6-hydroxy-2,4-cyclohexadiene-1-carboxylate synthase [Bacillota bacterium]|nr:2-succinyl-6-hydroxy-2,4-cyclohexadiene-1-carboxylate synthase [Bacillota bacterium]